MTRCIVGLRTSFLPFSLPYIYPFFFLSTFFVNDISTTGYDRKFIFVILNNNDKLYRGIENRLFPISSSIYLITLLSLHAIYTVILVVVWPMEFPLKYP